MTGPPYEKRWDVVAGRRMRSLVAGARRPGVPDVVLVPGLGAPGYLLDAVAGIGAWTRCVLLDLPGFGHDGPDACEPTIAGVAQAVATWLTAVDAPVVLGGHSTGAQAALRAAVLAPERVSAVVLAGLTFDPAARRPATLLRRVARVLATETPGELRAVAPAYARGRRRLVSLLRSGMADRPEDVVGDVACPMLLLRGRADPVCPASWVDALARRAPDAVTMTLPGGHNFPYGHAGATALAVARFVESAVSRY